MYVLVLILTIGSEFVNVKAVNHIYPTMDACKSAAVYLRGELLSTRPSPDSNVFAYCTEIPQEVQPNMSLEKEAKDFVSRRQDHFKEGIQERVESLDRFITDNLYHTSETREAVKHLIAVQMWSERSAKLNGIKK